MSKRHIILHSADTDAPDRKCYVLDVGYIHYVEGTGKGSYIYYLPYGGDVKRFDVSETPQEVLERLNGSL